MTLPPQLLKVASVVQLPLALAFVGLIALDMHLGLGLGETAHILLAAFAGAMGVKRPSELAERAAKALDESKDAAGE